MSDNDCNCTDSTIEKVDDHSAISGGWIEERPVKTAQFSARVTENMSRFFGQSIQTFDDMISAIRTVVEGEGIAIDELCHVEEETPHYAKTDDDTYYFRCFYDGVALAQLVDEPVKIRTETPRGEPIEMRATPDSDLDVTPSNAVMSFGVATTGEASTDDVPTTQEVYGAICPYVKAFHSQRDYKRWAADVPATTVGIPLQSGVPIAAALAAESPMQEAE